MKDFDFNKLVDSIPNGIVILDSFYKIEYFNTEALRLCDQLSADNDFSKIAFYHDEDLQFRADLMQCINLNKLNGNFYIKSNDIILFVFIKSVLLSGNSKDYYFVTLTDISLISTCDLSMPEERESLNYLKNYIIGNDKKILALYKKIELASMSLSNVLIYGESGTGKELVARAIHHLSARKSNPFVAVNCSSLSEGLLESELFGHIKGSFTGALADKIGKFESANGGTIFLDEIGEITQAMQVKILRVIQEKKITRVGGNKEIDVDMRIIAATNKNLRELVFEEKFREDLFYRLNVFPIITVPLRDRAGDIETLIDHFIKKYNKETKKNITSISKEALFLLLSYCWPGNVRELENAIEHAFVLCESDTINTFDLPQDLLNADFTNGVCNGKMLVEKSVVKTRKNYSKEDLLAVLAKNNGNKSKTADELGISRVALWKRLKKLD